LSVLIEDRSLDEKTAASCGTLSIGRIKAALPNKFPTTTEIAASKAVLPGEALPGEIVVAGRLIFPNSLKMLLTQDSYLKNFARRLGRETSAFQDSASMFFMILKGEASFDTAEALRTILDLQYFADFDILTVQCPPRVSIGDFNRLFKFAERWLEEKQISKPLLPVIPALDSKEAFEKFLDIPRSRNIGFGLDMRGGFYYHTLRVVEDFKRKKPESWVHAFQVPPKIRFAGRTIPCSQGMILPYFGVDSFSRWVVPPPPEPLTKEKINLFDRVNWGVFKKKEWQQVHGQKLACTCPTCKGLKLETFYQGKVLNVLFRSKAHDHYAQQGELRKSARAIGEHAYLDLLSRKRYARQSCDPA
jgi:hypothetical protein